MIEVVTDFGVLMRLAKSLGNAKKSGDQAAIDKAQAEHDAYRDLCLVSDEMSLGARRGDVGL